MKICGIVAEYNPFHNGHKYQIDNIKKKTNCDIIIAVMSGNFIERGLPASFDKWSRTKMAIENGVDIVIELPTLYATASAEYFAMGAVSILDRLNCVDYISFGAKDDKLQMLQDLAKAIVKEPKEYKVVLKEELAKGISYPLARNKSLSSYFKGKYKKELIDEVLQDPNNILAIEYLKALKILKSSITPLLIKRIGTDYNSVEIKNGFCSSTAIRELLAKNNVRKLKHVMPKSSLQLLKDEIKNGKGPVEITNFENEILYLLRTMDTSSLSEIADISEGLENTIKKSLLTSFDIETLIDSVKSKRYTRTRIQRILIHALLNIKSSYLEKYKVNPQYARVLGVSKNGKNVLSKISKTTTIPIVTSVNKFLKIATDEQKEMIELDIRATNIYSLGYKNKAEKKCNLDYTMNIIN